MYKFQTLIRYLLIFCCSLMITSSSIAGVEVTSGVPFPGSNIPAQQAINTDWTNIMAQIGGQESLQQGMLNALQSMNGNPNANMVQYFSAVSAAGIDYNQGSPAYQLLLVLNPVFQL